MLQLRLYLPLLLLLCLAPKTLYADDLEVVFLSPDNSRYWQMVSGFMQAVASDLDINLTVYTDQQKNRYSYRDLLGEALDKKRQPDFVMFMLKENVTAEMLKRTEKAGVKTFTFNTNVPEFDGQTVGVPRQYLKQWIGHLAPDNIAAGKQLAETLIAAARQKPDTSPPEILALSGTRDSSAATDRDKGLKESVERDSATLNQLLYAGWSQSEAQDKTQLLLERYPGTDVIWSASDGMALGAIQALESKGLKPGVDIMVGGVDWERRALDAIREGRLTASMGRHFMDGGVALLLIHDFNAGYDFANEASGTTLSYDLKAANRENLGVIEQVMQPDNWDSLDFTDFSRAHNPILRSKDLSANELMDTLMAELNTIGQRNRITESGQDEEVKE